MRNLTTIILLLFCLVGRGQVNPLFPDDLHLVCKDTVTLGSRVPTASITIYTDSCPPNSDTIYNLPQFTIPLSGFRQPTPIEQLLSHWKAYKQECWNDSTAYRGHISNKNPYTLEIVDYSIVWMHKEPTLEGFMDYLERKR